MPTAALLGKRPSGIAHRDGQLADLQVGRVAQGDGRQVLGVDLDEGEIGERVDAGHGAVEHGSVIEDDRDVLASPTTWPFVMIRPSLVMMTPEPVPPGTS